MALDALVDTTALDAALTATANAIRTKGGTSAQIAFNASTGFKAAVDALPSGGGGGGGGIPDIILPGNTPVFMDMTQGGNISGSSYSAIPNFSITVPKSGTYRLICPVVRWATGSSTSYRLRLYKNDVAAHSSTADYMHWPNGIRTGYYSYDIECAANDVLTLKGMSPSSSYNLAVTGALLCIDWNNGGYWTL